MTPQIVHPLFKTLEWDEYGWWIGKGRLPAWAGFQSRGGSYGARDARAPSDGTVTLYIKPGKPEIDRSPSQQQCHAYEDQIQSGHAVVASVLQALLPYYSALKQDWGLEEKYMPTITSTDEFRNLVGPSVAHLHAYHKDSLSYVGLEFGCEWDIEHGLGVMLHGSRVINIGFAETAFNMPDEATWPA